MATFLVTDNELYARWAAERNSVGWKIAMVYENCGLFHVSDDGPPDAGWTKIFTAVSGHSILIDGDAA